MTFAATVLTLYPEMFPGPLGVSLAGRALEEGKWSLDTVQIRDFSIDKHKTVDDTPAGGGAGMVLRADVLAACIDHAAARHPGAPRPACASLRPAPASSSCAAGSKASTSGFLRLARSRKSRSATSCCRAANRLR
jgi:tRNA G37 N-methylase TrmD